MARIKKELQQKEVEIYALVSQISNEVFVWKAKKGNTYQAYKDHVNGLRKLTKELCEKSEEQNQFPKMYLLETLNATEETIFSYCAAWAKYFEDKGFKIIAGYRTLEYIKSLTADALTVYKVINQISIDGVLSEENLLVDDFSRSKKSETETQQNKIAIIVNKKEYQLIKKKAQENKLTMSRYCKNMALNGNIVKLEQPFLVHKYLREVYEVKTFLGQIIQAIHMNGKYYPADLENIQRLIDTLLEQEKEVSQSFIKYAKTVRKILPR